MYCGQCGKKVMDTMLFCPFCGAPIVIPDQDEPAAPPAQTAQAAKREAEDVAAEKPAESAAEQMSEKTIAEAPGKEAEKEGPVSLFDADMSEPAPAPEEEFVPLRFDFDLPEEPEGEVKAAELELEDVPEEAPVRPVRSGQTRRPESIRKRPANTYIPVKDIAPEDIFMDAADEDEYDLDDAYDDAYDSGFDDEDDYGYEERDEGGFFHRHIRGFVGLILFIVLLAVCVLWASTEGGQKTLARFNLAWRAEVYAELGYQAYLEDNDLMAARYYEKALSRDEANYEYAHSAMVAYYEAEDIPASAAMLKRCIAMEPDHPEPYQEMLILYPDAATRPWEIRELIRDGYERTGDPSLKQD